MKKLYSKIKNFFFPSRVEYIQVPVMIPYPTQGTTTNQITPDATLDFQSVLDGIVETTRRSLARV